ncbi:RAD52 motif-containing protein 1-like [Megaptera novaeangliae]
MVPLVTFVVPIVGDKTLRVWELSSGPTAEAFLLPVWPSVFGPSLPKRSSGRSCVLCHHQGLVSKGCPQSPKGMRPEAAFSGISSEGSLSFLMKRKGTQKLAIQKAMTDAFWKLLIVVLGLSTENTTSENNTAQNVSEEIISTGNSTLPGGTGPGNTTHRNVSTAHSPVAADNSMPAV